ncbi:Hsp20 family protein [Psychrosphaera sp. B3R10]|uniref:Hsp20 family protein n=1 Tax=Psychrosphaera algicola TaxID=3023714 RepID=A0ABT5FB53_9GAMM|nr:MULTISPECIES: Hsp20 family protein [unclassified Psychrosphaera]MBU2881168.1 Hsp20 family protein [Psychrosphaera sp. I2R16]MBU2988273.1 Hsp20 family protein [Psychrosphaera sp. B3R10]MDC2888364.1 Hsp20 family protein [Psychrosphaera sp. G1-22]MDO6718482.1 Hsp20 family protein [Psychrosphaera sp. 1_MG-2023]
MRNVDLSPLYRSFIGFDHLATLLDSANRTDKSNGYPPYNIESVADDKYRITMAIAGFSDNELDIQSEHNTLVVKGIKPELKTDKKYLYQGIAERNFERRFQLGDYIKVIDAELENGLLHIFLEREVPEALKPRKIEIGTGKLLES